MKEIFDRRYPVTSLKFLFIQLRPLCFRQLVMWISAIKAVLFLMATMIRLLRPYLAW